MNYLERLFFKHDKTPMRKYTGNTIIGDLVGMGIFIGGGTFIVWLLSLVGVIQV